MRSGDEGKGKSMRCGSICVYKYTCVRETDGDGWVSAEER